MALITKQEIIKIARISALDLHDNEIPQILDKIAAVLSYAARVQEVAAGDTTELVQMKLSNVMRNDEIRSCNPKPLLAQAPQVESDYFVVPMIIKHTE